MDPLTLLPFLAPTFGGVSAAIAVTNFFRQSRTLSTYEEAQGVLEKRKIVQLASTGAPDEDVLLEALNFSGHLLLPLRTKLLMQLLIACGVIIGCFLIIKIDLPSELSHNVKGLEYWGFSLLVVQLLAGVANAFNFLMTHDEKEFLKNLAILHAWFYDAYVYEAMAEFNRVLPGIRAFRKAAARQRNWEDRFRARIREEVLKVLKVSNGKNPPGA